jgi:hypothetical protein
MRITENSSPLLFLPLIGTGADLYDNYRACARYRDALDLHLLKKRKLQLIQEKEELLKEKEQLLQQIRSHSVIEKT